jgi:hypothetical protein
MGLMGIFARLSIALLIVAGFFFFCPTQYLYYVLIIGVGIFAILGDELKFAFVAFLLFAVLVAFAYLAQTIGFFVEVWNLITPNGPDMTWSAHLPTYFFYVLPTCIAIMLCCLAFVGSFYRGWADLYLAGAFSSYMVYIFFAFTLLNCFFVGVSLYTLLSTTSWTLFVWELIFQWLPFFTLSFITYYLLGFVFDRPSKERKSSREAKRQYMQKKRKERSH